MKQGLLFDDSIVAMNSVRNSSAEDCGSGANCGDSPGDCGADCGDCGSNDCDCR
jgi:hypothetical protein